MDSRANKAAVAKGQLHVQLPQAALTLGVRQHPLLRGLLVDSEI